jgi:cell division protein FtsB
VQTNLGGLGCLPLTNNNKKKRVVLFMKFLSAIVFITFFAFSAQLLADAKVSKEDFKQQINQVQQELDELVEQGGKYVYM